MTLSTEPEVLRLLAEVEEGRLDAFDRLVPLVYEDLHRIAHHYLRREQPDPTLQTTALVHEAYIKLLEQRRPAWKDRQHLLWIAARVMRRVLVQHVRSRGAQKRGGDRRQVRLEEIAVLETEPDLDLLEIDEALTKLARLDARKAKLVELRFFAGLPLTEAAAALGVSPATAKRDWALAKLWILREMTGGAPR